MQNFFFNALKHYGQLFMTSDAKNKYFSKLDIRFLSQYFSLWRARKRIGCLVLVLTSDVLQTGQVSIELSDILGLLCREIYYILLWMTGMILMETAIMIVATPGATIAKSWHRCWWSHSLFVLEFFSVLENAYNFKWNNDKYIKQLL